MSNCEEHEDVIDSVRIIHISDTHCLHRTIEDEFPLPEGDILIHTGDFTNRGHDHEFEDFNNWLGERNIFYISWYVITD